MIDFMKLTENTVAVPQISQADVVAIVLVALPTVALLTAFLTTDETADLALMFPSTSAWTQFVHDRFGRPESRIKAFYTAAFLIVVVIGLDAINDVLTSGSTVQDTAIFPFSKAAFYWAVASVIGGLVFAVWPFRERASDVLEDPSIGEDDVLGIGPWEFQSPAEQALSSLLFPAGMVVNVVAIVEASLVMKTVGFLFGVVLLVGIPMYFYRMAVERELTPTPWRWVGKDDEEVTDRADRVRHTTDYFR